MRVPIALLHCVLSHLSLSSLYLLALNRKHEHVYTNGDICLSLLGKDWRPIMTAQSIAASILSILSSAQSKSIPMDNAKHSQNKPGQYQQDWVVRSIYALTVLLFLDGERVMIM